MTIANRSISSSVFNITSNSIQIVVLFIRSVILTRYLSPKIYGEFILISSIIALSQTLPDFGLQGAFLYKSDNDDINKSLKTHFSLTLIFSVLWLILITTAITIFVPRVDRWIYYILSSIAFFPRLTNTPKALLSKKIDFKRQATIQGIGSIIESIVAIGLVIAGFGIWSLIIPRIFAVAIQLFGYYGYRPVWKPKLGWDPGTVRKFLRFGSKDFQNGILLKALDRVDDIWTGIVLGETALGFYDRAFKFANYPRRIISAPINSVVSGTYAQVKDDRVRKSKAFSLINTLLIRVNFMFAGILALIAPEFIRIVIGVKWMPMLDAFRLMIIFTLLDPIKLTVASVITASGYPEKVVRARYIQLLILIVGLILFAPRLNIAGVAISVNLMLMIGIGLLFWEARSFVDFSLKQLFGFPTVGLVIGMVLARLSINIPGILGSDWRTAGVKIFIFCLIYMSTILIFEKDNKNSFKDLFINYLQHFTVKDKSFEPNNSQKTNNS